jgi:hypothetical protein
MIMNHRKQPVRRTYLEDRFEILIKRQKTGVATFSELTELDEMVNRYPEIRNRIIREDMLFEGMDEFNGPSNDPAIENIPSIPQIQNRSLLSRLKSLLARIFTSHFSTVKTGNIIIGTKLMAF